MRDKGLRNYVTNSHGDPMPCDDLLLWAKWFQDGNRRVAEDDIDGTRISTVFLGVDHGFPRADQLEGTMHETMREVLDGGVMRTTGDYRPVLWETMTFTDDDDGCSHAGLQYRYSDRQHAINGHAGLVKCYKTHRTLMRIVAFRGGTVPAFIALDLLRDGVPIMTGILFALRVLESVLTKHGYVREIDMRPPHETLGD